MTHRNRQSSLICQLLQLQFPQPQSRAVATTPIRSNQNRRGLRIDSATFRSPPSTNRCDGEFTRVVVGAHIDKASVLPEVVDAIRKCTRHFWTGEVVTLDF